MGMGDRIKNTAQQVKGKGQQVAGSITDNDKLKAEGEVNEKSAQLKNHVEDAKDDLRS